ncbi:MAG: aspartate carbamoyltransferase regulatory subunit [Bacteroidales bacterium]|jgi:aspartate carbamoyltransferase regulatory subunit|nr:aspartate carbamoyltransferase regulatory subunit [Bacteroidales bacterium]MCI2122009.1 aspartate carbamoyltransferase regulatory subunit [Bacteroidales bacterium]MCI2145187.1 aspartate carbamoyltransferase regulatory subunit [Bacteroidales bacterium]
MENEKQLKVSAIKNGTVLDHIPSGQLFKVIDILHLSECNNQITIGFNLESKMYGRKGIIKIADRYFADEELNYIALVAPNATVNIIKDFEVVEKKKLSIPDTVVGTVKCGNPVCVTNHEPIKTIFKTVVKDGKVQLLCHYCEKTTDVNDLTIIRNSR